MKFSDHFEKLARGNFTAPAKILKLNLALSGFVLRIEQRNNREIS